MTGPRSITKSSSRHADCPKRKRWRPSEEVGEIPCTRKRTGAGQTRAGQPITKGGSGPSARGSLARPECHRPGRALRHRLVLRGRADAALDGKGDQPPLTGYSVRVPRLHFSLFNLSVTLSDVSVFQQAHPDPPVAFLPRLHASV